MGVCTLHQLLLVPSEEAQEHGSGRCVAAEDLLHLVHASVCHRSATVTIERSERLQTLANRRGVRKAAVILAGIAHLFIVITHHKAAVVVITHRSQRVAARSNAAPSPPAGRARG